MKPTPSSMNVDMRPLHVDLAGVDAVDPRHALQQRALAGPVAPDDAEELARRDGEGDVVQPFEHLAARAPEAVEGPLLQRVVALLRHAEPLADAVDDDRGRAVARACSRPSSRRGV